VGIAVKWVTDTIRVVIRSYYREGNHNWVRKPKSVANPEFATGQAKQWKRGFIKTLAQCMNGIPRVGRTK